MRDPGIYGVGGSRTLRERCFCGGSLCVCRIPACGIRIHPDPRFAMVPVCEQDPACGNPESSRCDALGKSKTWAAEFNFRDSIVVSISACHAEDPGSIPGRGICAFHIGGSQARRLLRRTQQCVLRVGNVHIILMAETQCVWRHKDPVPSYRSLDAL